MRPDKEIIQMIEVTTGCSRFTAVKCFNRIFGREPNITPAVTNMEEELAEITDRLIKRKVIGKKDMRKV